MGGVDRIARECVRPGDSPRFTPVDEAHAARLAELATEPPPILVHRPSMRVIDGAHRLRAAALRGEPLVAVEYFEGTAEAAFALAVERNIEAEGLPLSVAERKAAAERIVRGRPELSDRSIAQGVGLSAKTVGEIRRRAVAGGAQASTRMGRDGRLRPINPDEGRRRVLEVLRARPGASLREIAQAAGVSLGTAHGVRSRVHRGEEAVPTHAAVQAAARLAAAERGPAPAAAPAPAPAAAPAPVAVRRAPAPAADRSSGSRSAAPHRPHPPVRSVAPPPSAAPPAAPSAAPAATAPAESAVRRLGPRRGPNGRSAREPFAGLALLRRDPSLRFTDHGRALLVWLHRRLVAVGEAERELQLIPPHLLPVVAELALECAESWRELADQLQGRARQIG